MKIAAAVLLLIALTLVALWMAYVSAPEPEAVCEHKIAITVAEAGDQHGSAVDNLIDQLKLECVKEKRKLLQLRGKIVYARQAKCIMAATSLSAAERCG